MTEALIDLAAGRDFYEEIQSGAGAYFIESLLEDIDSLRRTSGSHRLIFDFHRLLARKFPFAIYYRVAEETVQVVAVLDMRQKPDGLRGKLGGR